MPGDVGGGGASTSSYILFVDRRTGVPDRRKKDRGKSTRKKPPFDKERK